MESSKTSPFLGLEYRYKLDSYTLPAWSRSINHYTTETGIKLALMLSLFHPNKTAGLQLKIQETSDKINYNLC